MRKGAVLHRFITPEGGLLLDLPAKRMFVCQDAVTGASFDSFSIAPCIDPFSRILR